MVNMISHGCGTHLSRPPHTACTRCTRGQRDVLDSLDLRGRKFGFLDDLYDVRYI